MYKFSAEDRKTIVASLMALSVLFMIFAAIGMFYIDLILASTQWVLLAVFTAVWGVFLKMEMKV